MKPQLTPGKVYLVGAGPGHPELLTIKAAELIKSADVIVYDRLIQEEILSLTKPSAERLYMGKPVSQHASRQDEINEVLVRKSGEGKVVVRLKGGDPFLFGRGGEEAEYLADHGVPFEVIPGVSSALAAPISAGISVTHRDCASCVAIVTGHEARDDRSRLDWQALSRIETLVFLMSVHNVGRIAEKLMAHGRSPETPAAMVQMAFWQDERVVTGTLATIAGEVTRSGVQPPATLIIGEVVRLREKLRASQRDLARHPDGSTRFQPAPPPEQLLRLATGVAGAQLFASALRAGLFDRLEEPRQAEDLAGQSGMAADALADQLDALVSLGLLEYGSDGYRNLELASRYLRAASPHSMAGLFSELASCGAQSAFAAAAQGGGITTVSRPAEHATEPLLGFSAPYVARALDLRANDRVLVLGCSAGVYREAITQSHPMARLDVRNGSLDDLPAQLSGGRFHAIVLSGEECLEGNPNEKLRRAAGMLVPGGMLILHAAFLPAGVLPAPEVMLGALALHPAAAGARLHATEFCALLRTLGFTSVNVQCLPAATTLITARIP